MYEIWVLQFTPSFFRPFFKYWRFQLPNWRWRVIVALAGGNRRRLISRVVDARFFNNRADATEGLDRIEARLKSGQRPWGEEKEAELIVPVIGSDAAEPRVQRKRDPARPRPGIFVLRPRNGLPSFRRKAGYRLENGVITATDRRGRYRSFPLDGTAAAPVEFGQIGEVDGLVDGEGNMLTRSYGVDWGTIDFVEFIVAADLLMVYDDPQLPVPPLRSDGIVISTFNPIPTMLATSTVGLTAARLSYSDLLPTGVTRTALVVSVLGFLGSFAFAVLTDADAEHVELRSPRSTDSQSRRRRRKARKRRLRQRASGG